MRIAGAVAALAAALLCGCATAPPDQPRAGAEAAAEVPRSKPLASYAADPFVPVNLYLNANEQATGEAGPLIEYAAQQLRDSGAFVRVDRGVQRWPITIQARYVLQEERPGRGRRFWNAVTLGLVDVPLTQKHVLVAEIFDEPDSVAVLDLSALVREPEGGDDADRRLLVERRAVDSLLERMVAEIAQRKLIPRWGAFKPEPRPPRKKKVEGRPT